MKYSHVYRQIKVMAIFIAATLAACGQAPDGASVAMSNTATYQGKTDTTIRKLIADEDALRNNLACKKAPDRYLSAIVEIIERFNENMVSWRNTPYLAYHPGGDDGISVLFCADGKIAAYAYPKTIAVHDQLLSALEDSAAQFASSSSDKDKNVLFLSALAFVIYHELGHAELGHPSMIANGNSLGAFSTSLLELKADAYAASALHATGFSIEGAEIVFDLLEKTNPTGAIYHPTSNERAVYLSRYSSHDEGDGAK